MKPKSAKYLARAQAFADAVDLAVEIRTTPPWEDRRAVEHYNWLKARAVPPYADPMCANLRGLTQLESIFFTEWNEGSGEDVERFWKRVAERGLPFQRRDIVREVLTRGRINSETEFQTITDGIVILQQMGHISAAEADKLGRMIEQFEQRARKRHVR
ncbi:MAG: hypothetical protein ACJ8C7_02690 [Microvirga sp.]